MTLDKNFGEEILHKIKDEKLQPKPRWQFLFKDYVVWCIGALALFLGAIAMSLIFYMSSYEDLGLYNRAGGHPWEVLFLVVPFFWIICLALLVFVVSYNVKHTKKGYRYPLPLILIFIIIASIILGGVFYAIGFGERVDDELGKRAPFYDRVINPHVDFWSRPEEGRLMGMIISQSGEEEYILVDRERGEWSVSVTDIKKSSDGKIEIGKPVRLLGKIESEGKFKVNEILSMMPGKGFFKHLEPLAQPPMANNMLRNNQGACGLPLPGGDNFDSLLNKYPEVKEIFVDDLLKNKDLIKKIIEKDPRFIKNLESLNIGTDTIIQLQK